MPSKCTSPKSYDLYTSPKSVHQHDLYGWRRNQKESKLQTEHLPGPPRCLIETLHWKLIMHFQRCESGNLPSPQSLAIGLYNSLYYHTSRDDKSNHHKQQAQKIYQIKHNNHLPGLVHVLMNAFRWNSCVRQVYTSSSTGSFLYSKTDDEDASMLNNGSSKIRLRRSNAKCETGNFPKFQLRNMWPGTYARSLLWQQRQKYLPKYSQYR